MLIAHYEAVGLRNKVKGLKMGLNGNGKRMLPILTALVMVGSAGALLLSGLVFSGNVAVSQGEQPDQELFTWDIVITDDSNNSQTFLYNNPDGAHDYQFVLDDSNIESATTNCTYESGADLHFYVNTTATNSMKLNGYSPTYELPSGNSYVTLVVVPNVARCQLTGSVSVTAELV